MPLGWRMVGEGKDLGRSPEDETHLNPQNPTTKVPLEADEGRNVCGNCR